MRRANVERREEEIFSDTCLARERWIAVEAETRNVGSARRSGERQKESDGTGAGRESGGGTHEAGAIDYLCAVSAKSTSCAAAGMEIVSGAVAKATVCEAVRAWIQRR